MQCIRSYLFLNVWHKGVKIGGMHCISQRHKIVVLIKLLFFGLCLFDAENKSTVSSGDDYC